MSRSTGGVGDRVLAIDLGTSMVKAGVFGRDGQRFGFGAARPTSHSPQPGWSEQPSGPLWSATVHACRQAVGESGPQEIEAVSITGARGSIALDDGDCGLLTDFITWQDRRSTDHAESAAALVDAGAYYRTTGGRMDASLWLPKLLWLAEFRTELVSRAGRVITPPTFVAQQFGADHPPTEWSAAAYSGLFDIASYTWHEELVRKFGVPSEWLPPLAEPGTAVGVVSAMAAELTGISQGAALVLAAADGPCADLGCGVVDPGALTCYLGTAISVAGPLPQRIEDDTQSLLIAPGATRGNYRMLALGLAGASVLDWYRAVTSYQVLDGLDALVEQSSVGSRGVLFVPALAGAGAPLWSPHARGAFLGLEFGHTKADLVRAMLEGVAFECSSMIDALGPFGFARTGVRIAGGGSRSRAWTQMIADLLDAPVIVPNEPDPGLRGAAAYALVHCGFFADVIAAAGALEGPATVREPTMPATGALQARADTYRLVRQTFLNSGLDEALAKVVEP